MEDSSSFQSSVRGHTRAESAVSPVYTLAERFERPSLNREARCLRYSRANNWWRANSNGGKNKSNSALQHLLLRCLLLSSATPFRASHARLSARKSYPDRTSRYSNWSFVNSFYEPRTVQRFLLRRDVPFVHANYSSCIWETVERFCAEDK